MQTDTPQPGEREKDESIWEIVDRAFEGDPNRPSTALKRLEEFARRTARKLDEADIQLAEIAEALNLSLEDYGEDDRTYWLPAEPGPVACSSISEAVHELVRIGNNEAIALARQRDENERLREALREMLAVSACPPGGLTRWRQAIEDARAALGCSAA